MAACYLAHSHPSHSPFLSPSHSHRVASHTHACLCCKRSSVASSALHSTVAAFLSDLSSFSRGKFFKNVSVGANGLLSSAESCLCARIMCDAASYDKVVFYSDMLCCLVGWYGFFAGIVVLRLGIGRTPGMTLYVSCRVVKHVTIIALLVIRHLIVCCCACSQW